MDSCTGCEYWIDKECYRYPPNEKGYPMTNKGCGERRERASEKQETKKDDGHSGTSTGEIIPEESWSKKNVQKATERLFVNERKEAPYENRKKAKKVNAQNYIK